MPDGPYMACMSGTNELRPGTAAIRRSTSARDDSLYALRRSMRTTMKS